MPVAPPPATAPLPTRQVRSARTLQRILDAAEALLAEGELERITLEQIAERAHVSIGAFYKRFRGKSTLLPLLLDRLQQQLLAQLQAFLAQPQWSQVGLGGRIDALLALFADSQQLRHRLIRTLLAGHYQSPDRLATESRSVELMTAMHGWLLQCEAEIRHPEPRLALSLGLYAALQALQGAILHERIPPGLGSERFTAEIARMLKSYLLQPA